jgi:hypothetical protein
MLIEWWKAPLGAPPSGRGAPCARTEVEIPERRPQGLFHAVQ